MTAERKSPERGEPIPGRVLQMFYGAIYLLSLPTWLPMMPPTAAPPIVPTALPPVRTAPPTAPTPAPIAVSLSRVDISLQPAMPSITAAATALTANLWIVFIGLTFLRQHLPASPDLFRQAFD